MGTPSSRRKSTIQSTSIPECEWDFSTLPDAELVACCYWEYARESAFIRETVQNLKDVAARKGSNKPLEAANRDLTKLYSIGTPADLFYRLPFPGPWQLLNETARKTGAGFIPEIPVPEPMPAFRVSNTHDIAGELYRLAREIHDKRTAMWRRLAELSTGMAGLQEATDLRKQLCQNAAPVVVRGIGGVDSFVAQINWQDFTDNEIALCFKQWVTNNRPTIPGTRLPVGRRNDKGRKLNDWRVMLDRLSIMRLLNHATPSEIRTQFPAAWKQHSSADWFRERKRAKHDFHRLFPFVENELPLSWRTKAGHG